MRSSKRTRFLLAALGALALGACGGDPQPVDPCMRITCPPTTFCLDGACLPDGTQGPARDGGQDGGAGDAGADGGQDPDAGMDADGGSDAGMETDAGTDAGMEADAGTQTDAGMNSASMQLAAARATPDGTGLFLPVSGVVVTYFKPAVGTEGAGFTVQSEPSGPALFVYIDPSLLAPAPAVGDTVAFTITAMGTLGGNTVRMATELAPGSWSRLSAGTPVSPFVQDLSAATDLVSDLNGYEAELVQVAGTISSAFSGGGPGHTKASLTTAGYPAGDALLKLRVPIVVRDAVDLAPGCNVTVNATPLWRLGVEAQVAAWTTADLTVGACPAPKLLSAVSLTQNLVELTFDRLIAPGSVSGASFTFTGGLVAFTASVNGKKVSVGTSSHASGTTYTVSVGSGVTDQQGTPVDPTANSASFTGFGQAATVVLNEINPNISGGKDLIELTVTQGGTLSGIRLEQLGTTSVVVLATLPDVQVAPGDLVVVHLTSSLPSETTSKVEHPSSLYSENYDGAWDVHSASQGVNQATDRIIRIVSSVGATLDAVPFIHPAAPQSATFLPEFNTLVSTGGWVLPAPCAAASCTYGEARGYSVDWSGMGFNDATSIYRAAGASNRQYTDWLKATSFTGVAATFGAPNP